MPERDPRVGLFPALLRHWRRQRGLSQLDLAVAAEVSTRHVSFLETGRSSPSAAMILRLAAALSVPLRHVDAMLTAAGHEPIYAAADDPLPAAVADALALLKAHHEPYPLIVVDRSYRVRDLNHGALALLGALLGPPAAADADPAPAALGLNLALLTFDPRGAQPHIVNFAEVGRALLWRVQREVLAAPDDGPLRELLDALLAMPTLADDWRDVDLTVPSSPALVLHLRRGPLDVRFLTMITAFQAPHNVAAEELRVEMWLPYDDATAAACRGLAGAVDRGSPSA